MNLLLRTAPAPRRVHEAEAIVAEERSWACRTCDTLLGEHESTYCHSCALYWRDVEDGLFQRDEDWP